MSFCPELLNLPRARKRRSVVLGDSTGYQEPLANRNARRLKRNADRQSSLALFDKLRHHKE